jgi:hypothetical protein
VAPKVRKLMPVVDVTGDRLVVNKQGIILKLKTGTINKVHDVAVRKKEPIQFWN